MTPPTTPEEAFWDAFWDEFWNVIFDATPGQGTGVEGVGELLGTIVLAYVVLSCLFVIFPWQRIIWKAGFRGRTRRILRILMSSPPVLTVLTLLTASPLWAILLFLMPLAGFLWIAFAPWPNRRQRTAPAEEPPVPPPATKFGTIDMLQSKVWVVRCVDGAYWIREEELERLDLPLATRLGKAVTFVPIPNVKIPPKYIGKMTGVVRNGLTRVAAIA